MSARFGSRQPRQASTRVAAPQAYCGSREGANGDAACVGRRRLKVIRQVLTNSDIILAVTYSDA